MTDPVPWNRVILKDLISGMVVFLVALPLCLGIANASKADGIPDALNATILSGILAGIIGGIVVGLLSGSQTSVSGPAAGLTAVVAVQIAKVGSFDSFLMALVLAGLVQIGLGLLKAGSLSEFFPSSVIKGLLTAIGVLLILKQLPHLVGHDKDPDGEMSFFQPDQKNTFTELIDTLDDFNVGALTIGFISLAVLIGWDYSSRLKKSIVPSALIVVLLGVLLNAVMKSLGGIWEIEPEHHVQLPVTNNVMEFVNQLTPPKWSALELKSVYLAALILAVVASLETLLNLEAVDKLDPQKRVSPTNRELVAQGVGNTVSGLIGGLPVTSVIVRSSANINAGARTKLSAVFHGVLLFACVAVIPHWLNQIPLSALAAILLMTGYKLASPKVVKQMWSQGWDRFLPFIVTVIAIVLTDLLVGILIGLAVASLFIVHSNLKRPSRVVTEKHISGDVLRIELANQVSFLNRANLTRLFDEVPTGSHVLLDARSTDYIDPDILDMIYEYRDEIYPARKIQFSLVGFQERYQIEDRLLYVDYSTRDLQTQLKPTDVLKILQDGNERFRSGQRLNRDLGRDVLVTASGQFPLAVVLSCIDSRSPAEMIFDLGLGDIFSIRIAGNVAKEKVFGSMEYACAVAKTKLILVLGHTRCGAVTTAVDLHFQRRTALEVTGCEHLDTLVKEIQHAIPAHSQEPAPETREPYVDHVARENVLRTMKTIQEKSHTLDRLIRDGSIAIVGGLYDVRTGAVDFFDDRGTRLDKPS